MSRLNHKRECLCALAIILVCLAASTLIFAAAADTTIFNNQGTSFWTVYNGGGQGNLTATITTDTSIVQSGSSSSLKQVISPGDNRVVGFYHLFSPTADWSSYSAVTFWLYGSNSGDWINFAVIDQNHNDYLDIIQDDFIGWQQFTLNFSTAFSSGTVDLTNIYLIEFAFANPAPTTLYVDQLSLISSTSPTPSTTPTSTPTSPPSPTPTSGGGLFYPSPSPSPTATPISSSPTPTVFYPTSSPSPTPTPTTSSTLTVYVMNGSSLVTTGTVTIGSTSVPLNSDGTAVFTGLNSSTIYHMSIVVSGVTVYDNDSFAIPASGAFTVNLAPSTKNSTANSWTTPTSLAIIAVILIIAIAAVIVLIRKRNRR